MIDNKVPGNGTEPGLHGSLAAVIRVIVSQGIQKSLAAEVLRSFFMNHPHVDKVIDIREILTVYLFKGFSGIFQIHPLCVK